MDSKEKYKDSYNIPLIADKIKLSDFFNWHDNILTKKWEKMNSSEKIFYCENNAKKEILGKINVEFIKKMSLENIAKGLELKDKNELYKDNLTYYYYKVIEFQKLKNDFEFLNKTTKQYISEIAINKILDFNSEGTWIA